VKNNSSKSSYIKLTVSLCGEGDGFVVKRLILQLPYIIAAVKSWNRFTSYWSWICCRSFIFPRLNMWCWCTHLLSANI